MEPDQTLKRTDEKGKTPSKGKCKYCGNQMHRKRRDCPAFGQVCRKCNKSNHFASACNAKQSNSVNVVLSDDNSDSDLSVLHVETVATLAGKGKQVLTELIFCIEDADRVKYKKSVVCQLDTAASCNVNTYRDLSILLQNGTPKLQKSSVKLKIYDDSIMQPIGETALKVKHNDSYHTLKFQVVDSPNKPLLSAESCEMLGLLQFNVNIPQNVHVVERTPKPPLSKEAILNTFTDVFEELGHIANSTFVSDETVKPVQHTPRRVSVPCEMR